MESSSSKQSKRAMEAKEVCPGGHGHHPRHERPGHHHLHHPPACEHLLLRQPLSQVGVSLHLGENAAAAQREPEREEDGSAGASDVGAPTGEELRQDHGRRGVIGRSVLRFLQ